jgi:ribose transport system substrate-binding protein
LHLPKAIGAWALALLCVLAPGLTLRDATAAPAAGTAMRLALTGKSSSDINFLAAWQGCLQEAQQHGDTCQFWSPEGPAQARLQDQSILDALASHVRGVAVSVIRSDVLAQSSLLEALQNRVPVVTFDSDLVAEDRPLRRAYVGPDNLEVGRTLGRLVARSHPKGGVLCLMSGNRTDPNLNQRMLGVRQALSGQPDWPVGKRLQGQGGWTEAARCPWFNDDVPDRALRQLKLSLVELKVDALVSVGHWPVVDPAAYELMMAPLMPTLHGQSVFVCVGEPTGPLMNLLNKRWLTGMVSMDFKEMGRQVYQALKRLTAGETVGEYVPTPVRTFSQE